MTFKDNFRKSIDASQTQPELLREVQKPEVGEGVLSQTVASSSKEVVSSEIIDPRLEREKIQTSDQVESLGEGAGITDCKQKQKLGEMDQKNWRTEKNRGDKHFNLQGGIQAGKKVEIKKVQFYEKGFVGSDENQPKDLTKSFSFLNDEAEYAVDEGILETAEKLKSDAIVIICCDDNKVANSGAQNLLKYCIADGWESWRSFSMIDVTSQSTLKDAKVETSSENNFTLHYLLTSLEKIPDKSTVIVDLTAEFSLEDATSFFAPFVDPNGQQGFFTQLKCRLRHNRVRLVCLVPDKKLTLNQVGGRVHVWYLDAVKHILKHHFEDDHAALYNSLQQQIKKGQWGDNPLVTVQTHLLDERLKQQIEHYERDIGEERRVDKENYVSLLREAAPISRLHEAVLFTTVYYPRLSESQFEEVLTILLNNDPATEQSTTDIGKTKPSEKQIVSISVEGQKVTVEKIEPASTIQIAEQKPARQDEEIKTEETLMQTWFGGSRKMVSAECRIRQNTAPNGRSYIGFAEPHLSVVAHEALKDSDPFYFSRYFDRILDAALIFKGARSIGNCTIDLIVQRMQRAPEQYNSEWLIELVLFPLVNINRAQNFQPNGEEELLRQLVILAQEPLVMNRLTRLLRLMLADNNLAKVANDFLNQLFQIGEYGRVLAFCRRLRDAAGFDVIFWLKRLIANGEYEVQGETYLFLREHIRANAMKTPQVYKVLMQWAPAFDSQNYPPPLQQVALFLPVDLIVLEMLKFQSNTSSLPDEIFPVLSSDAETLTSSIFIKDTMILLHHPSQEYVWKKDITRIRLYDIANCLLGNIKIGAVSSAGDSDNEYVSAGELLVEEEQILEGGYHSLLSLLLTGWAWGLIMPRKENPNREKGEQALFLICQEFAKGPSWKYLKRLRGILFIMQNKAQNIKDMVDSSNKIEKRQMSRFASICRIVANMLYQTKKRS